MSEEKSHGPKEVSFSGKEETDPKKMHQHIFPGFEPKPAEEMAKKAAEALEYIESLEGEIPEVEAQDTPHPDPSSIASDLPNV